MLNLLIIFYQYFLKSRKKLWREFAFSIYSERLFSIKYFVTDNKRILHLKSKLY